MRTLIATNYFIWIDLPYIDEPYINSDEDDCIECEEILEELEQIDGEADMFGIDFVKIASHEAAQKYEVNSIPALVYFR